MPLKCPEPRVPPMPVEEYYRNVMMPGNVAVSAMRRAGIPINVERIQQQRAEWVQRLADYEAYLSNDAKRSGIELVFSEKHVPGRAALTEYIYGRGKGYPVEFTTPTGLPSTDDEALLRYASISNPWPDDDQDLTMLLKIRSLSKGINTFLDSFEGERRNDGCVHPHYNWARVRTARISAERPPVHQIPEHADAEVAKGVKRCIVPRHTPCLDPDSWDPRIHGSCIRWDISGAEAAIRAAMLTWMYKVTDPIAWEYIRLGKDIHAKTAALIYGVPDGTFKKGDPERDRVGKQTFFASLYGAWWTVVRNTIWIKGREWVDDEQAKQQYKAFREAYTGLTRMYELDKLILGVKGYAEDGYGRRRWIGLPAGVRCVGMREGETRFAREGRYDRTDGYQRDLKHRSNIAANSPTQSMNASDSYWMLALCTLGEYVELRTPPLWDDKGKVLFPEVAKWALNEGPGPGGKPFLAWHINTVHDSGWLDCAPGYLEPAAKVIYRRCTAVPFHWRIAADVPYRIDVQVGPDMGTLYDYNKVAAQFGLEPLPKR